MEYFFINNLNLPFIESRRKGEIYDRFIDEHFIPADVVCIAGGISEYLNTEITFLIKLAQKYSKVVYVLGGCDLVSDIPLDLKFEKLQNNFRKLQKNKCTPERMDGNVVSVDKLVLGGFMGFDNNEDISNWNWWTDSKLDYMEFETERYNKIINKTPDVDIIISYYHPDAMNIKSKSKIWHYGYGNKQEIIETNGQLLLTNSCHNKTVKYSKNDFLFNL